MGRQERHSDGETGRQERHSDGETGRQERHSDWGDRRDTVMGRQERQ